MDYVTHKFGTQLESWAGSDLDLNMGTGRMEGLSEAEVLSQSCTLADWTCWQLCVADQSAKISYQ
jgi:hypothetical protein